MAAQPDLPEGIDGDAIGVALRVGDLLDLLGLRVHPQQALRDAGADPDDALPVHHVAERVLPKLDGSDHRPGIWMQAVERLAFPAGHPGVVAGVDGDPADPAVVRLRLDDELHALILAEWQNLV